MLACALAAAALGLPLGPTDLPADVAEFPGPDVEFPFRRDALAADPRGAVRVRLLVSRDQGRTWAEGASAAADAPFVTYAAPGDGVYWFALQAEFRNGGRHPDGRGGFKPEMKVFVNAAGRPVRSGASAAGLRRELLELRSAVHDLRKRVEALEAGRKP